jgi:hypothetical protein
MRDEQEQENDAKIEKYDISDNFGGNLITHLLNISIEGHDDFLVEFGRSAPETSELRNRPEMAGFLFGMRAQQAVNC